MVSIKPVLRYLSGKDILENRKRYLSLLGEKSQGIKLLDFIDTGIHLATRYVPTVLELDAARRLIEGHYLEGTLELFFSEYVRVGEHYRTKREEKFTETLESIRGRNRELIEAPELLNGKLQETLKRIDGITH